MTVEEIQQALNELELKKKQLEVDKLEVEKEKIQLERDDLKKAWFKKQPWWGTIVSLLIGAAGVYVAFSTNIFGIQKLEKDKDSLNIKINLQKKSIKNYADTLKDLNVKAQDLTSRSLILYSQRRHLTLENDRLAKENKEEKKTQKRYLVNQVALIDKQIKQSLQISQAYGHLYDVLTGLVAKGVVTKNTPLYYDYTAQQMIELTIEQRVFLVDTVIANLKKEYLKSNQKLSKHNYNNSAKKRAL